MANNNNFTESSPLNITQLALLEALPDAVYLIDQNGVILNTNTLFAAQFAKLPEECIGINVYDLIENVLHLPELAVHHREKSEAVLLTGERVVFADERDVRKVTISPVSIDEGKISALLITIQNIAEQKRIDKELQKERALKNALLDTIPCSAIILDANLQMIVSNRYAQEMLFNTSEAGRGKIQAEEFFSSGEMGDLRKKFIATINSGIDETKEIKVYPHGGPDHLWLLTKTRKIVIDGQPCAVSIGVDISEHKRIETELIESKRRFTYALDAARSGVWEWDVKSDQLIWSKQVWKLYGLQENSVPLNNQLCVDTIHPDDREMASWVIRNALTNGIAASLEYRTCYPDGSVHWLTSRAMPLHDDNGVVTRYIGTIIDITERKETEIALSESKARLNLALKAASAGVWEWDLNTGENIWSDEIWPLYGLEHADNTPSFELWAKSIHNDDRETVIQTVVEAARNETELKIEYRVVYPDCSVHWLLSRGKPIVNDNGMAIRYIGTIIDITEQKQTELALSANKTRFSFALEATNAGVWEWDVTTDKIIWSEQVWALYGLEQDSLPHTHKLCASTVHPDDRESTFQKIMAAVQKETRINIEYRVCHPNGSIHWLMCQGMPLLDVNGEVGHYIGTVMDITERKERDREIVESRSQLKQALEAARAGTWEWDLISGENTWSEEARLLHGMKQDNPKPSFEFWASTIHPDDREMAIRTTTLAAENKTELNLEYRISYNNGSTRWLMSRGKPLYKRDGNVVARYIGTIIDITDQKQFQSALRESELKFRTIFDHSPVSIAIRNVQDGTLVDVNDSWLQIFGYTKEEVIGRSAKDLGLYVQDKDTEQNLTTFNEQGKILNKTLLCRKKNGSIVHVLYSGELFTLDGKESILVMMTDITVQELQQINIERLTHMVDERTMQLNEEVEHLRHFINMISHEYRTPLAIIRSNINIIKLKNKRSDNPNTPNINKINKAIDRLVEVMEIAIEESRVMDSKKTAELTIARVASVVDSQLDSFRNMWDDCTIHYTEQLGNAEIYCDLSQFKLAIFNLLDNARKYSPPDSPIELEACIDTGELVISIRNISDKISQYEEDAVFEKYRRGSNAVGTAGAGLGLWLVRTIINQHNGQVTLARIASGIEVKVRLPLALHDS
ncbi:MAG: PAS domain-containing protein [Chlorobiaceae bacterium]|nr:PAS domain-containing protein [Chlorobiaceae bacterium]